jgi:hypothetical protein
MNIISHGHLESTPRLLDRSPKRNATLYRSPTEKSNTPTRRSPSRPTHIALCTHAQQRKKLAPPSISLPIRGWVGELHEGKNSSAMGEIHRVPPATQQHEVLQKVMASETNNCSLGPPLMDMDVQERRCPRQRQWADSTLQGGVSHKKNGRGMDKAPITTGSDEGLPVTVF